jgi:hypothetical protein
MGAETVARLRYASAGCRRANRPDLGYRAWLGYRPGTWMRALRYRRFPHRLGVVND